MKKLLASLILLFALTGCGDDVTNINGYTDAEVKAMIDSTLDAQEVVVMNDTVYQQTVDTIYNMVIDTVTHELVDTIYQRVVDTVYNDLVDTIYTRVVDTVMNELVDTIYQRVVDTVYHELVDTIYQKVIDTVFTELERVGVDVSKPRDTIITLSDTTDGIITAKTYKGVVYKNVFYEAHEYQYGLEVKSSYYSTGFTFHIPESYVEVPDKGYENYSTIKGNVYLGYQCGEISKPDYNNRAYKDVNQFKKFAGWRLFDETDAYEMAQYLNMIVSDTTLVYLSILGYDARKGGYNATANIAKYKVPSQVSRESDAGKLKYICAYDLK